MRLKHAALLVGVGLAVAGCHTDMWVQPKLKAQKPSTMFADGMGSRPPVPGTVAQGKMRLDDEFFTGRVKNVLVEKLPAEKVMEALKVKSYKEMILRGKERFEVFCTPCHGAVGDGKGMIAQRGLELKRTPGNYHTDRLRPKLENLPGKPKASQTDGHLYDVITNGYGVMYSYASRIEPADRWAIVSYIRVLQMSQNMPVDRLSPDELTMLEKPEAPR